MRAYCHALDARGRGRASPRSASVAGCGEAGSSGTAGAGQRRSGAGCAPVAGDKLVVLDDDKKLQNIDNIIPAINEKAPTRR